MPRYGFHCQNCDKKFRKIMSYEEYGELKFNCPYCDSKNLKRLIDRVRITKSEDSRMSSLESMADPATLAGIENDPISMGRLMREMSKEMGEDMGDEFDEVVKRLEKGESPEEIESAMPDLGNELGASGGGMGGDGLEDF